MVIEWLLLSCRIPLPIDDKLARMEQHRTCHAAELVAPKGVRTLLGLGAPAVATRGGVIASLGCRPRHGRSLYPKLGVRVPGHSQARRLWP